MVSPPPPKKEPIGISTAGAFWSSQVTRRTALSKRSLFQGVRVKRRLAKLPQAGHYGRSLLVIPSDAKDGFIEEVFVPGGQGQAQARQAAAARQIQQQGFAALGDFGGLSDRLGDGHHRFGILAHVLPLLTDQRTVGLRAGPGLDGRARGVFQIGVLVPTAWEGLHSAFHRRRNLQPRSEGERIVEDRIQSVGFALLVLALLVKIGQRRREGGADRKSVV